MCCCNSSAGVPAEFGGMHNVQGVFTELQCRGKIRKVAKSKLKMHGYKFVAVYGDVVISCPDVYDVEAVLKKRV